MARSLALALSVSFFCLTLSTPSSLALEGNAGARDSVGKPAEIKQGSHVYKEQSGDLPNFHEVHPYLYRGGEPTAAGLARLKEMGVKTIFDLRGHAEKVHDEQAEAKRLGITAINLPMTSAPPTKKQVETMMKAIKAAKTDPANGSVFVHCAHGSDRTGCMIGIWRVSEDRFTYDQAYNEMRKYYFTPKFTRLSSAVKEYAQPAHQAD